MVSFNKSKQVELSILPTHVERSDAAPEAPAPAQDRIEAAPHHAWSVGRILKYALVGSSLLGTGALIGATSAIAARPTTKPHTPTPETLPAFAPSAAEQAACLAPVSIGESGATTSLSKQTNAGSSALNNTLYNAGGPVAADIADVVAGPTIIGQFGLPGTVRASVLSNLAQNEPQFIEQMIQEITPNKAWLVRMYDRDENTNAFRSVHVRVDKAEIDANLMPVQNETALWWLVGLQAGAKFDNLFGVATPTTLVGDLADPAASRRQAIESLVGANVEIVSADALDALRNAEVQVVDPSLMPLINGTSVDLGDYKPNVLLSGSQLIQAKSDNIPAIFARMTDRRNICMVTLHDNFDLAMQNYVYNTTALTVGSGANITLPSNGAHWLGTDSFKPVTINVPGETPVSAYVGPAMSYVVMNSDADAVWLQRGPAVYSGYLSTDTAFKVPMDLLEAAAASITIARRPCESDNSYRLPTVTAS